jgi:hypothetical protein
MNTRAFLFLAILLTLGITFFFWPSDEKKISRKLDALADYCSSENSETGIETLQKAALAAKLCTDPCTVHMESLNINRQFGRKEFTDRLLLMKKRLPDTRFSFHDTDINKVNDNQADVITTLRLNGKSVNGEFTDAYEMHITVVKNDGGWHFSSFTVVEFMKK